MEYNAFKNIFEDIFRKNGLDTYINDDTVAKFAQLTDIMIETNKVMNITALTTVEKIIPLHYADCCKIASYVPQNATVIDIGCGGGFPILPLAIIRPDLKLVGLDSTDKKVRYMQKTADTLGLHIETISGRAEDIAKKTEYRDFFDISISRAVARLNILDELCLPFVKIGGKFIALKGAAGQEEMDEIKSGVSKLGGKIDFIQEFDLFMTEESEKRTVIVIDKECPTPIQYPRAFGVIKKKPL